MGAFLAAAGLASVAPLAAVFPHYAAAFAGVFYLRFLQSLTRLTSWPARLGPILVGPILAGIVIALFVFSGRDAITTAQAPEAAEYGADRLAVTQRLEAMPGKQLVMVRYAPNHMLQNEWVFNAADLQSSKIIWAREMAPDQDRPFLEYSHDRQAWLLEADRTPPLLVPYTTAPDPSDAIRQAFR
jgi:hypothetical protein